MVSVNWNETYPAWAQTLQGRTGKKIKLLNKAKTPEGKVKDRVKSCLDVLVREKKAWYFMPVQSGMGASGIPDFVGVINGISIQIETKAFSSQNPTPKQANHLREHSIAGGLSLVVDSENADFILSLLVNKVVYGDKNIECFGQITSAMRWMCVDVVELRG